MRVGVVGAGGIGGYIGGMLAHDGNDVVFIARGAHGVAIRENGLTIEGESGQLLIKNITCIESPESVGPVEALLFCVKAYDVEEAAKTAAQLINAETAIITLQNGLNSAERFRAVVPDARPLPGSAYISARLSSPGIITNTSEMSSVIFGTLTGEVSTNARRFQAACERAGLRSEISADIQSILWSKLVFTASTSGLAAVGRVPNAHLFRSPALRSLTIAAMEECLAVAAAERVRIPPDLIEKSLELADKFPSEMYSSMCLDVLAGRRLEIDVFSGAVVRLATQLGLQTPIHQYIYSALKPS